MAEAITCFQTAVSLRPEYVEPRWLLVEAQVPAIPESGSAPAVHRNAFAGEHDQLDRWFDAARSGNNASSVRIQTPFFLAYQEQSNRDLLRRHGNLCSLLSQVDF